MAYQCPVCHHPLTLADKSWRCPQQHVFDLAKEGYVNLLPVQHKRSKAPGDSQEMMRARRSFLDAGYYQPLREAIFPLFQRYLKEDAQTLLDIGCGEGYYTAGLARQLKTLKEDFTVYGLDIAKGAIRSAAKRYKQAHFCVASGYRLPFIDCSIDAILRIYAPGDEKELGRVSRDDCVLITVTPAPNHLKQLKSLIYQRLKLHDSDTASIAGFTLREQQRLSYSLALDSQHSLNLLQMTPFAWRADRTIAERLRQLPQFNCDADFYISVYAKS